MKNKIIVILTIILLSTTFIFASETGTGTDYYRSYLNIKDEYAYWGNDSYPKDDDYGISVEIDESSVSHSQIDITVTIENELIETRNLNKFYVLFNDRIVHEFYPAMTYLDWANREGWITYYKVKPHSIDFVGADVEIRVIGVETNYGEFQENFGTYAEYVVAWSAESQVVRFKDFPTIDRTAIGWLQNIYYKLEDLLAKLRDIDNKLARISEQLATMFTPSEQAKERLEKAGQELMDKLPMKDMIDESKELSDTFKNSTGAPAGSELTIGPKHDYFNIGRELSLFDFTQFKKEMELMRRLLQAVIWIEFFMFILFYLAPKLDI